jgi:hypothetical protein
MALGYIPGSPGVSITETELDQSIVNVSVSVGATVGKFNWGPAETPYSVVSEYYLAEIFGTPDDDNYKDWFTAANFLAYSNNLFVARAVADDSLNACSHPEEARILKSYDHFVSSNADLVALDKKAVAFARYPGEYGNKLRVVIADKFSVENSVAETGQPHILQPYINQLLDENSVVCAVFIDNVITEFGIYSLDKNARTFSGLSNYIFSAVNSRSNYVYLVDAKILGQTKDVLADPGHPAIPDDISTPDIDESEPAQPATYVKVKMPINIDVQLSGGTNGNVTTGDYLRAWDLFNDPDNSNVSLLMQGGAAMEVGNYIANTIAEMRKDSIACVSPQLDNVANLPPHIIMKNLIDASNDLGYSRFRFMDGNYKFQYDRYNDVYRWVPLNGDMAGIFAQVDAESAPWFSPGGHTVRNTTKLAFLPTKADRDILYQYRINPVTSFNGTGAILYGDWTGHSLEHADNFVNVRRMLSYVEKSIQNYARVLLWQLNDEVTAESFLQTINPFLRSVMAGRGIQEYRVIADSSVNTPDLQAMGVFRAKVLIRPTFSIRFVIIEFSLARNSATFNEAAG